MLVVLIDKHHNHFEWPLPCPHKGANPRSIPRGEAKSEGKGESRFLSLNQERQEQGEKHAFFVFNQTPAIFLIKKTEFEKFAKVDSPPKIAQKSLRNHRDKNVLVGEVYLKQTKHS